MSILAEWAAAWSIPDRIIQDLHERIAAATFSPEGTAAMSEAGVSSRIRLAEAEAGARLWRNNLGAVQTDDGRHIRYGLCNESAKINRHVKSSDFIGIKPRLIQAADVGTVIGQFYAIEVKAANWHYSGDEHEQAQFAFLTLVNSLGGIGKFSTGTEYIKNEK